MSDPVSVRPPVLGDGRKGDRRLGPSSRAAPGAVAVGSPGPLRSVMLAAVLAGLAIVAGCAPGPRVLSKEERGPIDRTVVESPAGFELHRYVGGLTGPTSIAFDDQGSLLVAEGGLNGAEPRIIGFKADGTRFDVYPRGRRFFGIGASDFQLYGPIGGMVFHEGKVYLSHRDKDRMGVITALGYDGSHRTVVADLPAQGDYSVTDIAVHRSGRLYFGVGAATNSGVVGLDNWEVGWVRRHPKVHDQPWTKIRLHGFRFDTLNPLAGLFGGRDVVVTAPFQPFATSNQTWVSPPKDGKINGAIYSIADTGGELRLEAWGIRLPRGLAFDREVGRLYITNNGMELRGTRPVRDDPDALYYLARGWYGWPDYSADLLPITDPRFQPPLEMVLRTGYPDLAFLINHQDSGRLLAPNRNQLLQAAFPSQSGAAKMDFAPPDGPFARFGNNAVVALGGDRAPFATGPLKLRAPVGYKIVRVNTDTNEVKDFIRNTSGRPAHLTGKKAVEALERPVDVKFGPDGSLYVLDMGRVEIRKGSERVTKGSGQVFVLAPIVEPAELPTTREAEAEIEAGRR